MKAFHLGSPQLGKFRIYQGDWGNEAVTKEVGVVGALGCCAFNVVNDQHSTAAVERPG